MRPAAWAYRIAAPLGLAALGACSAIAPPTPAPAPPMRAATVATKPATAAPVPAQAESTPAPTGDFAWPAVGKTIARFDDALPRHGIDIATRPGETVRAARDGRVVLVSSALPAYGTMVVLKHDERFISAYAHVGSVLVHENEWVHRGEPIAEMAGRDSAAADLHFEIRKMGVAVDPEPYLRGLQMVHQQASR